jgi:hypothetical protein
MPKHIKNLQLHNYFLWAKEKKQEQTKKEKRKYKK